MEVLPTKVEQIDDYLLFTLYKPTSQINKISGINEMRVNDSEIHEYTSRGFRHDGRSLWIDPSLLISDLPTLTVFKSNLKTHLFSGVHTSLAPIAIYIHALVIRHN